MRERNEIKIVNDAIDNLWEYIEDLKVWTEEDTYKQYFPKLRKSLGGLYWLKRKLQREGGQGND